MHGTRRMRWAVRRSALAVTTGAVALGATAAAATAAPAPARFGYDDCTATEVYVPVPREVVEAELSRQERERFRVASLREVQLQQGLTPLGLTQPQDPVVHVFVRAVSCRDAAGAPARSLWIGPVIHRASAHNEGQQSQLLWRLYTDHEGVFRSFADALPTDAVQFVEEDGLQVAFREATGVEPPAGPVREPVLHGGIATAFEGTLTGTRTDDMRLSWIGASPRPAIHLPELRGIQATWYVSAGTAMYRIASVFPQRGLADPAGPMSDEGATVFNFRLGAAAGQLTASAGTRLARLLGSEDETQAPPDSVFTHARSLRQEQCIEQVRKADLETACLPTLEPPR